MFELTDEEYHFTTNSIIELEEIIARVRALHKPYQLTKLGDGKKVICITCIDKFNFETKTIEHIVYPCPTIEALDGEQ